MWKKEGDKKEMGGGGGGNVSAQIHRPRNGGCGEAPVWVGSEVCVMMCGSAPADIV